MQPFAFLLAWLTFAHCLLFGVYWMTNRPYHRDVNGFLANMLGKPLPFVAVFLGLSLVILLASLAAILTISRVVQPVRGLVLVWSAYAGLAILYLVFFYGSFWMLFREDPVQRSRFWQMGWYFRLVLDVLLLLALAWFLGRVVYPRGISLLSQNAAGWVSLGILALSWLLPVFFPPLNVYRDALPPKPLLIAHRGAAWLAPENTLSAMQRAVDLGVFGLESDVHLSRDGVLFLMHDANLKRTTDIETIYPDRVDEHASQFTWVELSRLNAGDWFVSSDPYGKIAAGKTEPDLAANYRDERIPRLSEMLGIGAQNGQIILFDLYDPPQEHPYHGQALQYSLEAFERADLGAHAWVLVGSDEIELVRSSLPSATLVAGIDASEPPSASDLLQRGYQVVNSEYSLPARMIQAYRRSGLWVNLYTVDEAWQYSRLWLQGVDSTTSNNVHGLAALQKPVFGLKPGAYFGLWLAAGLLAGGLFWMSLPR